MPILVDEDWDGTLSDHVSQLLQIDDRNPVPKMVEILGASGHLLLLINSLSERGMTDATDQVTQAVGEGIFKSNRSNVAPVCADGPGLEPSRQLLRIHSHRSKFLLMLRPTPQKAAVHGCCSKSYH